jgi:hypothetical protein
MLIYIGIDINVKRNFSASLISSNRNLDRAIQPLRYVSSMWIAKAWVGAANQRRLMELICKSNIIWRLLSVVYATEVHVG